MDLDDLLAELFGESDLDGLRRSRKAQLLGRMFFGALGAALGVAGAVYVVIQPSIGGTPPLRLSMALLLFCVASFFGFNVMLARRWVWPAVGIVGSLVALFASRILFGA